MTPQELKERLDNKDPLQIIDVRENDEFLFCNLGGLHIPLHELPSRVNELDPDAETVLVCHHGIRSAHATAFLRQQRFTNVHNLSGGIERWAAEVDPTMKRY